MRGDKTRVKLGALVIVTALVLMGMTALTGCIEEEEEVDEMRIGMTDEPGRFNPIEQEDVYSNYIFDNIFDPLVSTYPEGEIHTDGTILEEYEVSEDGLTYTFEVRDDVYFHHGEQLTAEDIKFTFHCHAGDVEELYDVENVPPSAREPETEEVEEVEVVDDFTVKFHMHDVNSEFLHSGLMSQMWALPMEWIEENSYEEFSDDFKGHGPYEFEDYSPGNEIVLVRNDDYHGEHAEIERVVFEVFDDESSAVAALRAGRIHYLPSIEATNFFDLQEDDHVNEVAQPSLGHQVLSLNQRREPWDDVRVRQALAYAIDAEEVIDTARTDELAYNVRTPVHPEHPAHLEDHEKYERDLEKAEDLLEEAGYPEGPEEELRALVTVGEAEDEMVVIQEHLGEIGFELDIVAQEFGTHVEDMIAGNFDLAILGWSPTASAEYAMTYYRYGSPYRDMCGWWNTTHTEKFEENITNALRSFGDERIEHYKNAQRHIVNDVGNYVMYARRDPAAYHEDLEIPEEAWNPFSGPVNNLEKLEFVND